MNEPDTQRAPTSEDDLDHRSLAKELAAARATLIELLRTLPESRAYRATTRPGWTLKHELTALGAADSEMLHVLEELRRRSGAVTLDLRRRRAETMHSLQHLRLAPLIERLEQDGARVIGALNEHGHELARAVHLEEARREGERSASGGDAATPPSSPTSATALAHAYRVRVESALAALREALGH